MIPAAVEAIGGRIEHFGMPVDPGNLLLIGNAGGVPVLGAPGCARSPVENGFDWVLTRLLAGLKVTRSDLTGMGVGGLLMEIITRPESGLFPSPREIDLDCSCPDYADMCKHVAAALEGTTCVVHSQLREVVEERKLRFDVEVVEGERTIGVGSHERRVIKTDQLG